MSNTIYSTPRLTKPDVHPKESGLIQSLNGNLISWVLVGFVFSLPVIVTLALYINFQVFGLILPGVSLGGVPVGAMPEKRAAGEVDRVWNMEKSLVISNSRQEWIVTPADFGLWLNPEESVREAKEVGRGPDGLLEILQGATGQKISVSPVVVFYPEIANAKLESLVSTVSVSPKNAELIYENGKWTSTNGQPGLQLDVYGTLAHIAANPSLIMMSGYLDLKMNPIPPEIPDLSKEAQRLQGLVDSPLVVQAFDPITDETLEWSLSPDELAPMVEAQIVEGAPVISLDEERFEHFIDKHQDDLGPERTFAPLSTNEMKRITEHWQSGEPVEVLVEHLPKTYVIQPGDTVISLAFKFDVLAWKIVEANPGMDPNNLSAGEEIMIPSKNEMLPYPIVRNKRIVINISQQRMWTYEDGKLRDEFVISTGVADSPTQPGIFQVQTHEINAYASIWDLYMPHFLGIYEAWPGFMNGIHGLPMLSSGVRLWANVLGSPASYGCIILTLEDAENLYNWAEQGVVVEIRR